MKGLEYLLPENTYNTDVKINSGHHKDSELVPPAFTVVNPVKLKGSNCKATIDS